MGKATHRRFPLVRLLLVASFASIGWGCTGTVSGLAAYDYFATPRHNDPWSRKIQFWQARARAERQGEAVPAPAAVAGPGKADPEVAGVESLQAKYASYRQDRKPAMASELAEWIQVQARQHYVPDGPIDEWATLDETLHDLGFPENEVYRSIVYRRSDGQHHMVTLWFEDADDPWVIDPTGAMTSGMPRMSELPDWVPLKVFSHDEDFTVRSQHVAHSR